MKSAHEVAVSESSAAETVESEDLREYEQHNVSEGASS